MSDRDTDAARILERALETLDRTAMAPEDIAEHEERCRANRVAEIMARPAPSQPVVYRVNDDALIQSDRACVMADDRPASRAYVGRRVQAAFDAICDRLVPLIVKVAALEAAAKPRQRVKAVTRRV